MLYDINIIWIPLKYQTFMSGRFSRYVEKNQLFLTVSYDSLYKVGKYIIVAIGLEKLKKYPIESIRYITYDCLIYA